MARLKRLESKALKGTLTLNDVNKIVWDGQWRGEVEQLSLLERLDSLMEIEREHNRMCDKLRDIKDFFSSLDD